MLALGFADLFFFADYLAGFAVVVVFVDVKLDVSLVREINNMDLGFSGDDGLMSQHRFFLVVKRTSTS